MVFTPPPPSPLPTPFRPHPHPEFWQVYIYSAAVHMRSILVSDVLTREFPPPPTPPPRRPIPIFSPLPAQLMLRQVVSVSRFSLFIFTHVELRWIVCACVVVVRVGGWVGRMVFGSGAWLLLGLGVGWGGWCLVLVRGCC